MNRKSTANNFKMWTGFFLTLAGVIVALVGGFLAWPMFLAVAAGQAGYVQGVSVSTALLVLALVPIGFGTALFGQRLLNSQ